MNVDWSDLTIAEMQFILSGYLGYIDGDKKVVVVENVVNCF